MPTGTCKFPEHHGADKGSGGLLIGVAVAVVVVLASTSTAARVASDVLDTLAWVAGGLAVLAVTVAVVVIRRGRRRRAAAELPAHVPPVRLVQSRRVEAIERPRTIPGVAVPHAAPVRRSGDGR